MMQYIWAALRWNIDNYRKIGQTDLSDLENYILNNSINAISWQMINIIPKKLYAQNKEKLLDRFRKIATK